MFYLGIRADMIYNCTHKSEIRVAPVASIFFGDETSAYFEKFDALRFKVEEPRKHYYDAFYVDPIKGSEVIKYEKFKKLPEVELIKFKNALCFGYGGVMTKSSALFVDHTLNERIYGCKEDIERANSNYIRTVSEKIGLEIVGQGDFKIPDSLLNVDRVISDPVFLIGRLLDDAYSHFVWDTLSLLSQLKHFKGKKVKVLFPEEECSVSKYKLEFLHEIGIPKESIIFKPRDKTYRFKELYLSTAQAVNNHWITAPALSKLSSMRKKVGESKELKLYYLDRNDYRADVRTIENEQSLIDYCVSKGFKRLTPGLMSLDEKIRVFGEADLIVGQYGGGLQNHFLCKDNVKIICLQSRKFVRDIHHFTSQLLKQDVISMLGDVVGAGGNNSNFTIDEAIFNKLVDECVCNL